MPGRDFGRRGTGRSCLLVPLSGLTAPELRADDAPVFLPCPTAIPALTVLRRAADTRVRDRAKVSRRATEFHLRNAAAWANSAAGGGPGSFRLTLFS